MRRKISRERASRPASPLGSIRAGSRNCSGWTTMALKMAAPRGRGKEGEFLLPASEREKVAEGRMRAKGSAELEAFALPLTLALSPHACGERGKLDLVY